jgi:hypothetical protein
MKTYRGAVVQLHSFLNSALHSGEWQGSRPGRIIPVERVPGTYGIEGWVGPRGGLDMAAKSLWPRQKSNPDSPVVQPVQTEPHRLIF